MLRVVPEGTGFFEIKIPALMVGMVMASYRVGVGNRGLRGLPWRPIKAGRRTDRAPNE